MRTWFIMGVFCLILASMTFSEQYIMGNFYPQIDQITNEIRHDVLNGNMPGDKIEKLSEKWNKYKVAAFVFSSHENFASYDDCINEMEEYSKIDKFDFVYYKTVELENMVKAFGNKRENVKEK